MKKTNIIAVNGGKGGTGKTFVAVNLAIDSILNSKKVLLIDSDVENPNTNILLGIPNLKELNMEKEQKVSQFIPSFDESKCTQCGLCSSKCRAHSIFQIKGQYPVLMANLCTGCQACMKLCPEKAINSLEKEIGTIYQGSDIYPNTPGRLDLLIGVMKLGEVRAVNVIEKMLEIAEELDEKEHYDYIFLDQSPGAHCDVEFGMKNSDFAVCVTEPTPFGGHDLGRILELSSLLGKESHVILNRFGMADYADQIIELTNSYKSNMLGKIPLDQNILESYAQGIPFMDYKEVSEDLQSKVAIRKIAEQVRKIEDQYKNGGKK